MMNKELWIVLVPAFSWLCFALGGTQISEKIEGQKWIRRFVLPFLWGISVFFAGFQIWQAAVVAVIGCAILHQGYGTKVAWWRKLITFIGYGAIALPLGLSWWNLIATAACILMFILSNLKLTAATFVWKICEGAFGALIGISIAYILSGYGFAWFK